MINENINNRIPNNLKECRLQAGLSQYDVMIKLGLRSTDRISKWENGRKFPNLTNTIKLSNIYKVPPENLYPELFKEFIEEKARIKESSLS